MDQDIKKLQSETTEHPIALVLLAQLMEIKAAKNPDALFLSKLLLTQQLLSCSWPKDDVIEILSFIDWLMVLPDHLMIKYRQQIIRFEEEKKMAYMTSFERFGMKLGREEGLQQGIVEGLQKGLQKGIEQGLQQGMQKALIEVIKRNLIRRFGVAPASFLEKINNADVDTLLAYEEILFHAQDLKDLV